MSNNSVRGINLYSFYSILLPGIAFLIGVIPLLPTSTNINPLLAVIPLLAIGFISGQMLHTIGVIVQAAAPTFEVTTSHRELFKKLLTDNDSRYDWKLPNSLINKFIQTVNNSLELDTQFSNGDEELPDTISEGSGDEGMNNLSNILSKDLDSNSSDVVSFIYTIVRSRIHTDGRGRSRVFQSTYAFSRSVLIMVPLLWVIYSVYALIDWFNLTTILIMRLNITSANNITYTPIIADIVGEPAAVAGIATGVALPAYYVFLISTKQYKRYYVEYTMADYIALISDQENENENG